MYDGRCVNTLIAPLLGIGLDANTPELPLGEGLSLVRGETLQDAPVEAVWGAHGTDDGSSHEPHVLVLLTTAQDRTDRPPVLIARHRFRRVLTALRLFERGSYALGPLAWTRTDLGAWRPVALGTSGRTPFITLIPPAQEDELRAFCNLVARRIPVRGELAWALSRFEMACERLAPLEALTDYLLALRALLEPEGTGSGRLAQRLAVLCSQPETRADMAERVARAVALERSVMSGLAPVGEAHGGDRRRALRAPPRAAPRRPLRPPRLRPARRRRRAARRGGHDAHLTRVSGGSATYTVATAPTAHLTPGLWGICVHLLYTIAQAFRSAPSG